MDICYKKKQALLSPLMNISVITAAFDDNICLMYLMRYYRRDRQLAYGHLCVIILTGHIDSYKNLSYRIFTY